MDPKPRHITKDEMLRTFNCGIGMVLIIEHKDVNEVLDKLTKTGYDSYQIGNVTNGSGQIVLK